MEDKFLKLTNTVYKVLEFFPEADPLKNRAKDRALAIMENLILMDETSGWLSFQKEKSKVQLLEDIDVLLGYLWIGKTQGWLNSVNYLIIVNEYEQLRKEFEIIIEPRVEVTQKLPGIEEPKNIAVPVLRNTESKAPSFGITDRQKQIIEFLEKNEKAQVMDLQTILPDITKRTIRRDLDELLELGKILREGDFNQVAYRIKA